MEASANLQDPAGMTVEQAAALLSVSVRSVYLGKEVTRSGSAALEQAVMLGSMRLGMAASLARLGLPEPIYEVIRDELVAAQAAGRRYTTKMALARAKEMAGFVPDEDRLDLQLIHRWLPRLQAVVRSKVRDRQEDAALMAALRAYARVAAADPPPGLRPGDPGYPLDDD